MEAALEGLETIKKVQVRRCDEAGGLGGAGGWVGGCPYGPRGGYAWHILFEPLHYLDERDAQGRYHPGNVHQFNGDIPLDDRLSTNLGAAPDSPPFAAVKLVDEATSTLTLDHARGALSPGTVLVVTSADGATSDRLTVKTVAGAVVNVDEPINDHMVGRAVAIEGLPLSERQVSG
jgi:hypothetical protein